MSLDLDTTFKQPKTVIMYNNEERAHADKDGLETVGAYEDDSVERQMIQILCVV